MDDKKKEENKAPAPKVPELPPWKYKQKPLHERDDPGYLTVNKSASNKKWVFITIFLLIITNIVTAAYFANKGRQSTPQSRNGEAKSNGGTQPKAPGIFNPFVPDYSAALGKANDTRRKADLVAISTALNQYMVEFGPEDFPTSSQCIGTSAGCYDLASLLTPDYLRTILMDPTIGSDVNTGYTFYWDELQGFVMEAISEDGQPITIVR